MGLDQSAGKLKHKYTYEFENSEGKTITHKYVGIGHFQWRKHARLQEFMTRLYMKRHNLKHKWIQRDDNDWYPIEFGKYNRIRLKPSDTDELEKAINTDYDEYFCDGGFLWGHQTQEYSVNWYRKQDLEFVEYARDRLNKGKLVYYSCSW